MWSDEVDIKLLEAELQSTKNLEAKLEVYSKLANGYRKADRDKASHYWKEALNLARREDQPLLIGGIYQKIAQFHYLNASYDHTMHYILQSNKIFQAHGYGVQLAKNYLLLGSTYQMLHRFSQAINNFRKAHQILRKTKEVKLLTDAEYSIGNAYNWNDQLDNSGKHLNAALKTARKKSFRDIEMKVSASLGILYTKMHKYRLAEKYFNLALKLDEFEKHPNLAIQVKKSLGNLYNQCGHYEKAIRTLLDALQSAELEEPSSSLVLIHEFLSFSYEKMGDLENSLKHFKQFNELQNRKLNEENFNRIAIIENEHRNQFLEKEAEIHRLRNVELTKAYEELQSAQQQLISHERLALLGQLTTGIAHEIQNPLNFVKNFAEVSSELINDLYHSKLLERIQISKEDLLFLTGILNDLQGNNEKIKKHGMRAANIVKSMLMHAREKFSKKQLVNINSLLDESVELATQGRNTTDRKKNVLITKNYHNKNQEVALYPNSMGRVFLNIMNNAYYAIQERVALNEADYMPEIRIRTKKLEGFFEITIKNNGIPVPKEVRSKIFNPFFTTKLNGEGTGLGLSISLDIVVKEHGGSLKYAEDRKGFAAFKVRLPLK